MLTRSSAAKYATSVFFEDRNDLDIFIEDTAPGYSKIFANLLSRAMSSNISLERVYPLGSRNVVIEAAKKSISSPRNRDSVYIIDGDLYLLCGEQEELPPNVISLPRYCIENFLIEEEAIASIMDEENHDLDIQRLKDLFDYSSWLNNSKPALRELFIVFAIAHKLQSGIATVSRSYKAICLNEKGDIDNAKVKNICTDILTNLKQRFGEDSVIKTESEILAAIDNDDCFLKRYVSAKDFSLPLLTLRMKSITKSKAPNLSIKIRFSQRCDVSPVKSIVYRISKIIGRPEIIQQTT
ncbi:DUF4435 domain-containing protein [Pseudomonas sp. USHLN015]|uniref:DUF4435 domain-containing protein n=1 Tax=Pseudomonas sp. USHLN015 TaxID=3081296 RepID=UPI00301DA416